MTITVIPEIRQAGMRLGRHRNHDPRSRLFKIDAPLDTPLVDVDHTLQVGVLDQGDVGCCVLDTQVENLSWAGLGLTPAELATLNQELAYTWYHETTASDSYPGTWKPDDTGTDAQAAAKVLRGHGLISGWKNGFSGSAALAQLQKTPVQMGIDWKTGCDNPDADGIIHWTGTERGGHELLAHKYDASEQLVGIRNHWTDSWGLKGECWMPVAEWMAALQAGGDALVLIPRTQPAPTPVPVTGDPDLAAWWSATDKWSHARHTGSNAAAAKAARALATAKGLG